MLKPPLPGQTYVVGFLFNPFCTHVALIRKNKPAWQAGKLNGVGGKIEPGEMAFDAMAREWFEETKTTHTHWREFAELRVGKETVYFFESKSPIAIHQFPLMPEGEEQVGWYNVYDVINGIVPALPNLRWLIPLAGDTSQNGGRAVVDYTRCS